MNAVMITAPSSGSGKTTITMGILRALKDMGLVTCSFKTGPDYIDRAFLEAACRGYAGNLDMQLQGKEGLYAALSMSEGDYCVIEGAMGYFDGIYNTPINSSCDIAGTLGVNSILVYTPKGEMFSAIPKIKGMAEFEASTLRAVIFNGVTEKQYLMLKDALESHTKLTVLGYMPKMDAVELKSRHLGLVQSVELEDIDSRIDEIARTVCTHIDMAGIIGMMSDIAPGGEAQIGRYDVKAAVARDRAFSFYYSENLRLLEKACEVVYFSPLEDGSLPQCDLLYLGGGYPEVFKEELSANRAMLASIREYSQRGGYIYAECGGFMYLTGSIDGTPMAGVFPGQSRLTGSLQNFGYVDIVLKKDCMLGKKGDRITAHEFHKSVADVRADTVLEISKTMGDARWEGGYQLRNTYGGYPHISFLGNIKVLENILRYVERRKKQ